MALTFSALTHIATVHPMQVRANTNGGMPDLKSMVHEHMMYHGMSEADLAHATGLSLETIEDFFAEDLGRCTLSTMMKIKAVL